jgi:hypothetical protein
MFNTNNITLKSTRKLISRVFSDHQSAGLDYFNLPFKPSHSNATSTFKDKKGISNFLNGITRSYSVNMTKSAFAHSLSRLVILFLAVHALNTSKFVTFAHSNNKHLSLPNFMYLMMVKISTRVKSRNSLSGWIIGDLSSEISNSDMIKLYKDLSRDDWISILSLTPFSQIASDGSSYNSFQREINSVLNTLADLETDEELYDAYLTELANLPQCFLNNKSIPMWKGSITNGVSENYGIYRFRNSCSTDVYLVSQNSCSSMSKETLNLFGCFLKIFAPVYLINGSTVSVSQLPGETEFSVEAQNLNDCWEKLLSYGSVTKGFPDSGGAKSKQRSQRTKSARNDIEAFSTDMDSEDYSPILEMRDRGPININLKLPKGSRLPVMGSENYAPSGGQLAYEQ